ncbi:MAG TPA: glycoside hydrolase family 3 N-terminal domain-containing protein [Acidimicrobiales bacterium]|nr:glycoside hydrolase family 3 N-terminal domain-containing protein [Acidimicrobiales bacterium]
MRRATRTLAALAGGALAAGSLVSAGPVSAGTTTTTTAATTTSTAPAGPLACARRAVALWSLPRLADEVVAVSVDAAHVGSYGPAAHAGFGALLVFGSRAPATFARVVARLQRMTPGGLSMLVMSDEEGGGVARLTNVVADPPWARTMGTSWSPARIELAGERLGASMLAAGLTVDLAPVLDVDPRAVYPGARDPDGLRSFSGVAATVAADGTAFSEGLARAGVTAVVKHFPGLGGATGNTDYAPAATRPWPQLVASDLAPFRAAIAAGVPAVMVANARVPGLTAEPASLSAVVYRYLRGPMGFRGLTMTDSLSAGGISAIGLSVPAASVAAVRAGADLVLAGPSPTPASALALARASAAALAAAVTHGGLSRATLAEAAAQVVATRNVLSC